MLRIETVLGSAIDLLGTDAGSGALVAAISGGPGFNWAVFGMTIASFAAAAFAAWRVTVNPPASHDELVLEANLLNPDLPLRPEPRLVGSFETVLLVVLGVYLVLDRAGAWIHIPGTPLFIGELMIAMGIGAMASMRLPIGRAIRMSPSLKTLTFWMGWGAALLVLAITEYGEDAIRDSALWYYGIAGVFATFLLVSNPGRLGRWLKLYRTVMPYILAWFPLALILNALFGSGGPMVPFSQIPVVSHKSGNVAVFTTIYLAYIWLVDSEANDYTNTQRTALTTGGILVLLFAGMQNRGGLVAAAVGLSIAVALMKRRRSEFGLIVGGAVAITLTLALVSNVSVPLFGGRSLSADQLITNVTSIIDPGSGSERETSTTEWRLEIWGKVLDDVTEDSPIMGFGPGPHLGELYGVAGKGEDSLRNPHNSHVGILARMGFVGAVAWAVLWTVWAVQLLLLRQRLLRRGRNAEGAVGAWLVAGAVTILINAIFDPTLEGPQIAIWLWLLFGVGAALPLLYAGFELSWIDDATHTEGSASVR